MRIAGCLVQPPLLAIACLLACYTEFTKTISNIPSSCLELRTTHTINGAYWRMSFQCACSLSMTVRTAKHVPFNFTASLNFSYHATIQKYGRNSAIHTATIHSAEAPLLLLFCEKLCIAEIETISNGMDLFTPTQTQWNISCHWFVHEKERQKKRKRKNKHYRVNIEFKKKTVLDNKSTYISPCDNASTTDFILYHFAVLWVFFPIFLLHFIIVVVRNTKPNQRNCIWRRLF